MGTPNPKKPLKPTLTPEQAAELNRRQAARRQADKRERARQQAADEAEMLIEAEAQAKAEEESRVQHLADLERRVAEAEEAARTTQEGLEDALVLLTLHHDVAWLEGRGASEEACRIARGLNKVSVLAFREISKRTWTCTASEASSRAGRLLQAIDDRRGTLVSFNEPVTITSDVTTLCTPVTATVRNADEPESNADRSHVTPPVSTEEQAWIDAQDRSPYDPYEDQIERIEAIAEGRVDEDDDDGERF